MNGPIILNQSRENLADLLLDYREPAPAPMAISPWLAMSLLQKSIRRGDAEFAQRAAATLAMVAPDKLWRRAGAAAYEEVGIADLSAVSLVTAALAGKRFRSTVGGEWKVASYIVNVMVGANKCRAADDLLLVADHHESLKRARVAFAEKPTTELIRIALGNGELPVRAIAAWYAVGVRPRQSVNLISRRGEPRAFFDAICEAGLPHTVCETAQEGFRKVPEPLCPFVALLSPIMPPKPFSVRSDELSPDVMVKGVPSWAYDMYVREGRDALSAFLSGDTETAKWIRLNVPQSRRVNFLGTVVFRIEGGQVKNRVCWDVASELRRKVDIECHGSHCADGTSILELMRSDIVALNTERSNVA
ncbi:hypothetical protein [Tardiphaga sp. 11_C7_N12_6]|uniref:hypothetical protein n=1 Tax=Tardiphaga sp. 11_C7_N12_6 TaxID=3240789 RepID=UPI003F261DD8